MLQSPEAVPKSAHPAWPLQVTGLPGPCHVPAVEQPGPGAAEPSSCQSLLPELPLGAPLLTAKLHPLSPPHQDGPRSKNHPVRLPFTYGRAGCCSDASCCAGGSLRIIFPVPMDCSREARPCKHREYHLIAAALGLELLGKSCVANILNNSLCNVCPGYCGIHFIIRALGCTLLIILSNNLHSTVSV